MVQGQVLAKEVHKETVKLSPRLIEFMRGKHLVSDGELYYVDPAFKHKCDACGTMRSTGALFKVYDLWSKNWFLVASACYFKLNKRHMTESLRAEATERWEAKDAE